MCSTLPQAQHLRVYEIATVERLPVMRYTTLVAVIVGTPRTALRVTPRRGA
jgi:hypothetical protein